MIIEKQTEANIEQTGDSQESIGMSLDMDSAQVLMQMLSKNLYSDAIGSTIRECASNALDSHRRAGVKDPIIVSFQVINNQHMFSVEDFGIGLDAEDVKNIISKYGKSTKRNSSTELGMMGLGFKAPLAYSSSFYFVCRKNGVERKYMMYEGEDTNTIDLMYEIPTTERNGVKVIVPVKYSDKYEFNSKIKEQLAYFQDVFFDVPNMDNTFTIYRSDHFQWSELCEDNKLHLCLDDVYYPLDFDKLGIKGTIYFPVALRFGLSDGIFPTPNREAIRYTKEAKAIILEKIGKMADFYINKYNESVQDTENVDDVINWFSRSSRDINLDGRSIDISSIINFSKISIKQPKLKGLNHLTEKMIYTYSHFLMMEYRCKFYLDRGVMRACKSWRENVSLDDIKRNIHYVYSEKIGGNMKEYMKSINSGKKVFFVKKSYNIPLKKANKQECYMEMLNLKSHPKSEWRAMIKEWQYVVSLITKNFIDLDAIEIPKDFLDSRKKKSVSITSSGGVKVRKVKLEGDVIGKLAQPLEKYVDGQNCKFVSDTFKLQSMHKLKSLYVYGRDKDRKQMDIFFKPFRRFVNFVILSDREFNVMQKVNIHNWITMDQFIKGENKPFKRIATAYLLEELSKKYEHAFDSNEIISEISSDLFDKIEKLNEYEGANLKYSNAEVKKAILEIAEANMLFDMQIYYIYKQIKNLLDKLQFIDSICGVVNKHRKDEYDRWKNTMRDLFRYHKQKMDWKNYKIKLNDDVVAPVTEEIIEQA